MYHTIRDHELLRARGGFEVHLAWKDGALEKTVIRSTLGNPLILVTGQRRAEFATQMGQTLTLNGNLADSSQARVSVP